MSRTNKKVSFLEITEFSGMWLHAVPLALRTSAPFMIARFSV